uniref:Uncharacterized protein n=1 Tax=Oryza brachyantha TaxID=4533 RepID=J3L9I8_ORYBR
MISIALPTAYSGIVNALDYIDRMHSAIYLIRGYLILHIFNISYNGFNRGK